MSRPQSLVRRAFLANSCLAGSVGILASDVRPKAGAASIHHTLSRLTTADFLPFVGQPVEVCASCQQNGTQLRQAMTLHCVVAHPPDANRPEEIRRKGFSLLLRAQNSVASPAGNYQLRFAGRIGTQGDSILVFVHPVGYQRDADGTLYEVVFN